MSAGIIVAALSSIAKAALDAYEGQQFLALKADLIMMKQQADAVEAAMLSNAESLVMTQCENDKLKKENEKLKADNERLSNQLQGETR